MDAKREDAKCEGAKPEQFADCVKEEATVVKVGSLTLMRPKNWLATCDCVSCRMARMAERN